jgi:hypothetical protein
MYQGFHAPHTDKKRGENPQKYGEGFTHWRFVRSVLAKKL